MLVHLSLGLIIELLNLSSYLSMGLVDFLHSLLSFLTKLGWCRERFEVNGSTWIELVNNLNWRATSGLGWCSIICKLDMTKQFIPSFGAFLHKHP